MKPRIATRPRVRREYTVTILRHGHRQEGPTLCYRSTARIRWFTWDFFVRWFGRQPDRRRHSWHKDGFMAEAADRRGNIIQVEQTNWGDPRQTDGTWNQPAPAVPGPLLLITWPGEEERAS